MYARNKQVAPSRLMSQSTIDSAYGSTVSRPSCYEKDKDSAYVSQAVLYLIITGWQIIAQVLVLEHIFFARKIKYACNQR